jgi:hypothetical protein
MKLRLPKLPLYAKSPRGSRVQIALRKAGRGQTKRKQRRRRRRSAKLQAMRMQAHLVPLILSQNRARLRHFLCYHYLDLRRDSGKWASSVPSSTTTSLDMSLRRIFKSALLIVTRNIR